MKLETRMTLVPEDEKRKCKLFASYFVNSAVNYELTGFKDKFIIIIIQIFSVTMLN